MRCLVYSFNMSGFMKPKVGDIGFCVELISGLYKGIDNRNMDLHNKLVGLTNP